VGCGICLPICPENAIDLNHNTENQLIEQIKGISEGGEEPTIIAFLEKNTAYAAADTAGQTRLNYPSNIKIIPVPTTGRLGLVHLLHAFAYGADGIILIEGDGSVFTEEKLRHHVIALKKSLRPYGIKSLRLVSTSTTIPQYQRMLDLFESFTNRVTRMGKIPDKQRKTIMETLQAELSPGMEIVERK
jgi:heterodisulfide reductase subunit A